MNVMEQFKKLIRTVFAGVLIICETLVFAHIWLADYNDYIVVPFVQKGNWFFYFVYVVLFLLFLKSYDGLKYGTYRRTNLIIAQILATVTTAFIIYLQIVLLTARFVTPVPLLVMIVWDAVIIVALIFGGDFLMKKLFPARKTLVIYDAYAPEQFLDKIAHRKDKFSVEKVVNISDVADELEELVKDFEAVIVYDVHSEQRNKILKSCFKNNIRAYSTTKVSDILVRGSEMVHMFDSPLLLYRNMGLTFVERFLKRSFDIVFSLILLVVTSPFLLISALAIKLYDGGPVFFRQARSTLNGKVFRIHKFRSMIVDAEKDGAKPAEDNDPRITPVGKFLRASRLDELPQLIDILLGDMSFVGPRPERVEHVLQYSEEIPEFSYRLKVRGGLTGYAQLYGKYNTTPYDKLQLDLMYIQNYTFLLDIKLILMTVKIMFMKESTEGFTKENSEKINEKSKENEENKAE